MKRKINNIKILRIIHTLDPVHGGPQNAIIDNSLSLIKNGISVDILNYFIGFLKIRKIMIFL